MINLFITYRCNLACPYCFATDLRAHYPGDMLWEDFERVLDWAQRAGVPSLAFIGGEPTLHPQLPRMVDLAVQAGIAAVLFTNGLGDAALMERLAPQVSNFVVNYNDPSLYTHGQSRALHGNLALLKRAGAKITFSKNFSSRYLSYDYLLEGIARYGVKAVRYDISRPAPGRDNDHFTLGDTRQAMAQIVKFVKACGNLGVRTGLDCSIRLCDVDEDDRHYLERVSMKFTGICHPSLDIHPDLSASYCLPLQHVRVPDVTAFPSRDALMRHFAEAVRPRRLTGVSAECLNCRDFMLRCQGGCMALRRGGEDMDETG